MPSGGEHPESSDGAEGLRAGEQAERLMHGLDLYGDAFLAYLMLDGVEQTDPDIVQDFIEVYAGWYPDRRTFMREQLDTLGWTEAVTAFREARDLAENLVVFNWDQIWEHCAGVYRFEERLAGLHVFFQ